VTKSVRVMMTMTMLCFTSLLLSNLALYALSFGFSHPHEHRRFKIEARSRVLRCRRRERNASLHGSYIATQKKKNNFFVRFTISKKKKNHVRKTMEMTKTVNRYRGSMFDHRVRFSRCQLPSQVSP
jgi:hypothetical protein